MQVQESRVDTDIIPDRKTQSQAKQYKTKADVKYYLASIETERQIKLIFTHIQHIICISNSFFSFLYSESTLPN